MSAWARVEPCAWRAAEPPAAEAGAAAKSSGSESVAAPGAQPTASLDLLFRGLEIVTVGQRLHRLTP
jgi:hypothetical protein